ncbi:MAG TPA: 3'-5' exonuclease, partial [bacterium]|nr:3'-5' exonuclease [bacterium]
MPLSWLPDFVAVDIETSGLAAQEDDLLEIAGVRFVAGEPVDRFTTTLQSTHALGQRTARMTGLTDLALAEGLPAMEAVRALDAFAASHPLVAHNVSLDREFLVRFSQNLDGVDFTDNPWWDSLELAALVFPELDSLALEHVATALGIQVNVTHRAEADAELAGRVFAGLFARIADHWPPHLIATVREQFLAGHPFGTILRGLVLPNGAPGPRGFRAGD